MESIAAFEEPAESDFPLVTPRHGLRPAVRGDLLDGAPRPDVEAWFGALSSNSCYTCPKGICRKASSIVILDQEDAMRSASVSRLLVFALASALLVAALLLLTGFGSQAAPLAQSSSTAAPSAAATTAVTSTATVTTTATAPAAPPPPAATASAATSAFWAQASAASAPKPTPAPGAAVMPGLWQVYENAFKGAKYIDLTHTISPSIPVWAGFGPPKFLPTIDPTTGKPYLYAEGLGFEATQYVLTTDQLGTQLDPPAHWAPEYPAIDELPATFAVRPLVVISIVDQVAKNPNYALQVKDIQDWEAQERQDPRGLGRVRPLGLVQALARSCAGDPKPSSPACRWTRSSSCTSSATS